MIAAPSMTYHKTLYKVNDGFKYILNLIDTFSKYVWSVPLKTKTGLEVANAFTQIFKYDVPKNLHVDKGKEFCNRYLKQILNKYYNITMYSTGTDKKASIIEHFNRKLGDK
ncbi:Integrase catalytic domain-containing protein [Aphis craccivora]|uniref:Integrase catalytic domain-containing protein n=1 Tax=Aphis craccivora TaxID=307492 RepID=A0A6G0VWY5_APHCR|nr:Integrase catalytic domain-containing protein [Aphis craccivora]